MREKVDLELAELRFEGSYAFSKTSLRETEGKACTWQEGLLVKQKAQQPPCSLRQVRDKFTERREGREIY